MISPINWDDTSEAHLIPAKMHPDYQGNQMMAETGLNMSNVTGTTTMPMMIQEGNYKTQGVFYSKVKNNGVGKTPEIMEEKRRN